MSYFPPKLRVVEYNTQLCLFNILHKYKDTLQLLAFRDKQFFFSHYINKNIGGKISCYENPGCYS